MVEEQIEKLYQVVVGVAVAFLAISFSSLDGGIRPSHVLWLITLYLIIQDWIDSTGYEYFQESKILAYINTLYIIVLLYVPLSLRLIESAALPVWVYPGFFVLLSFIDFMYLRRCDRLRDKQDKK